MLHAPGDTNLSAHNDNQASVYSKSILITIIYCSFECSLLPGMCSVFLSKMVAVYYMLVEFIFSSIFFAGYLGIRDMEDLNS